MKTPRSDLHHPDSMLTPSRSRTLSMKTTRSRRLRRALAVLVLPVFAMPCAYAGNFLFADAGPYDYNNTANWTGGTINNTWGTSLTAHQSITFGADTTLSGSLSITNNNAFNHIFTGSGADRTLTLGGGISLGSSATNANKVTIGSTGLNQKLNVDLGGAGRTFFAGTNRTLELVNVLSGTGGITKTGTGTLTLTNTANTYTSGTNIGTSGQASGIIEVTKLADGGQASSLGTSSSANSIVFGGTTTGTLRYIGAGDSTNRTFLIGGVGAIFDASGSGALTWSAGAATYASTNTARTITFKGTSTGANTMSVVFADSGTGKTSILKQDAGRWILGAANTYTGDTTVEAGTLATGATGTFGTGNITVATGAFLTAGNASSFGDTATLTFSSTSTAASITLSSGTDVIGAVYDSIGATYMIAGTHDATALNNFFGTTVFSGLGSLTIAAIPEPSTYAVLAGAGGLFLAATRRRRAV